MANYNPITTRHGMTGTPEHRCWKHMWTRVRAKQGEYFRNYVSRGITVCERWRKFEHFFSDMGPRPSPKHSIDRIDNDGNYEPSNCRWATQQEQQNNRQNNRYLTYQDRTLTVAEWARELGVHADRIFCRLQRGWSVDDTLGLPIGKVGQATTLYLTIEGETRSFKEWSCITGLLVSTIKARYYRGVSGRDLIVKRWQRPSKRRTMRQGGK